MSSLSGGVLHKTQPTFCAGLEGDGRRLGHAVADGHIPHVHLCRSVERVQCMVVSGFRRSRWSRPACASLQTNVMLSVGW